MNLTEQEILAMNLEEAWEAYKVYRDLDSNPENYIKIRFGIYAHFDINEFIHGTLKLKSKKGLYIIRKRIIKSELFWTEIEERLRIMKKALLSMIPDDKITRSRLMELFDTTKSGEAAENIGRILPGGEKERW